MAELLTGIGWVLVVELLVLGLFTGFCAGLLGIGGGMIMVPFLTFLLGQRGVAPDMAVKMAIATSMTTILFTSVSSVRAHHKRGAVRWDIVRGIAPGVLAGTFWGPDTKGEANAKFVKEFEDKYRRIPSQYAAQSYEAALLLDSAIRKVDGKIDDHEAFRKALQAADFDSIRGKKLRFNNNQFPIQDLHVFEVVKDSKGRNTLKTIATPIVDAQDAFHEQCKMK